jgi:DNA-binding NarL/FixJ family response regulator
MTQQLEQLNNGHSGAPSVVRQPRVTSAAKKFTIAIVEPRVLPRECLIQSLSMLAKDLNLVAFSSVDQWREAPMQPPTSVILLCIGSRRISSDEVTRSLGLLSSIAPAVPVLLISDIEDPDQVFEALSNGVRGYIPTSATLDLALEAMRLVRAGGTYVPATSIMQRRGMADDAALSQGGKDGRIFTAQQTAVLKALRQGKANKLIAWELDLKESTVKVHMRNIMRKLSARNRTEVVCMTNALFQAEAGH